MAGVLQAHHRFVGAALAPLLSSLVVIATYLAYRALAVDPAAPIDEVPHGALVVLGVGTTLGVVALALPLLVPARRAGLRLRPRLRFPDGVGSRVRVLAVSGLLAVAGQQVATLVVIRLANDRGGAGTLNVYTYAQAVTLLPYAVLAVPLATAAFPSLAGAHAGRGGSVAAPGEQPAHRGQSAHPASCATGCPGRGGRDAAPGLARDPGRDASRCSDSRRGRDPHRCLLQRLGRRLRVRRLARDPGDDGRRGDALRPVGGRPRRHRSPLESVLRAWVAARCRRPRRHGLARLGRAAARRARRLRCRWPEDPAGAGPASSIGLALGASLLVVLVGRTWGWPRALAAGPALSPP